MKCCKLLLIFLFSVIKKMIQIVHLLHPGPIALRAVRHLPLPELALFVWEFHRGGSKDHFQNCCKCRNFIHFCLNEMWKKWDHDCYTQYGVFIFLLTKRSRFDTYCKNINKNNNELRHFYTYFQGYAPGIVTFM